MRDGDEAQSRRVPMDRVRAEGPERQEQGNGDTRILSQGIPMLHNRSDLRYKIDERTGVRVQGERGAK